EVIAAVYAANGVQGFRRLQGMFSFVLVDERAKRVFLVRDPVGKKPLFTLRTGGGVGFGSSVLPLMAAFGAEARIDSDVASFYWRRAYISPDRSAFRAAKPVAPGDVVVLDWTGNELQRVGCEPAPELTYHGESAETVTENIATLLARAVDRRLENN